MGITLWLGQKTYDVCNKPLFIVLYIIPTGHYIFARYMQPPAVVAMPIKVLRRGKQGKCAPRYLCVRAHYQRGQLVNAFNKGCLFFGIRTRFLVGVNNFRHATSRKGGLNGFGCNFVPGAYIAADGFCHVFHTVIFDTTKELRLHRKKIKVV